MATEGIAPLAEVEQDALCELANVAMARAATSLRGMVRHEVRLSVPQCEILPPVVAAEKVLRDDNPNLVAIRQDFAGAFSGRARC